MEFEVRRRQADCRAEAERFRVVRSLRAARRPLGRSLPLRAARALHAVADRLEATADRAS